MICWLHQAHSTPLKTNGWNPKMKVDGRWFSFFKGWFSGSSRCFSGSRMNSKKKHLSCGHIYWPAILRLLGTKQCCTNCIDVKFWYKGIKSKPPKKTPKVVLCITQAKLKFRLSFCFPCFFCVELTENDWTRACSRWLVFCQGSTSQENLGMDIEMIQIGGLTNKKWFYIKYISNCMLDIDHIICDICNANNVRIYIYDWIAHSGMAKWMGPIQHLQKYKNLCAIWMAVKTENSENCLPIFLLFEWLKAENFLFCSSHLHRSSVAVSFRLLSITGVSHEMTWNANRKRLEENFSCPALLCILLVLDRH